MQHVFHLHVLLVDVVSDRGPQFSFAFWAEFCKLLGATSSLSSGFHPQSNGQTERKNQDIEVALRCMVSRDPTSWSSLVVLVEYNHNSLISSATSPHSAGQSPSEPGSYLPGGSEAWFSTQDLPLRVESISRPEDHQSGGSEASPSEVNAGSSHLLRHQGQAGP